MLTSEELKNKLYNNGLQFSKRKIAIDETNKNKRVCIDDLCVLRCFASNDLYLGVMIVLKKGKKCYSLAGESINYGSIYLYRDEEKGFTRQINNWKDDVEKQYRLEYVNNDLSIFKANELIGNTAKIIVEPFIHNEKSNFNILDIKTTKIAKLKIISAYSKIVGIDVKNKINRRKDFTNIYDLMRLELLYNQAVANNAVKIMTKKLLAEQYMNEIIKK